MSQTPNASNTIIGLAPAGTSCSRDCTTHHSNNYHELSALLEMSHVRLIPFAEELGS
jgi:hypothetical protein